MCTKYQSCLRYSIAVLSFCGLSATAAAQYYYKDILVTGQIAANYRLLKTNKVIKVSFGTFIQNEPVQDGIQLEQTINSSQNSVTTYTNTTTAGESWLISFYNDKGLPATTIDSSKEAKTITVYSYTPDDRIVQISNTSTAKDGSAVTEAHNWVYNATGQLQKMIKIKNDGDTTLVLFTMDEKGNVAEEQVSRNKNNLGTTYYYYDDKHRLTDIARYNKKADRILPDYMFEFNNTDQLTQMIVVPDGSSDYQTWRYTYNAQGLKQQEICYNKQKQLMGKVEYNYHFRN
jgi:hypothetical protein